MLRRLSSPRYNCDEAIIVRLMVAMSRSYLERGLDTYFCQDIIKYGKKVLALEFLGFSRKGGDM